MGSDNVSKPNKIQFSLTEAAIRSGIVEMYIEDNTVALTIRTLQLDPFTERVSIVKNWDRMMNDT